MSISVPIAGKSLLHNRRRLTAALSGVVFAVVLLNMQIGILQGFVANGTGFMDGLPADVWVMARGTPNFDMTHGISAKALHHVLATEGVEWAEKMIVTWSIWQTSGGKRENVEIVGLASGGNLGIPWEVDPPGARLLVEQYGVIIDRAECERLEVQGIGEEAEILGRRVKISGFTTGMRSFTTSPYAIMRLEDADVVQGNPGTVTYVAARARQGVSPGELKRRLQERLPQLEVLTAEEFRARTRHYWLFTTGVGTAFLMAAIMGFLVGAAVVSQVLYSMVTEQRAQFGVLKAVGGGNRFLCRMVLRQALLIAIIGYVLGLSVTWPLAGLMLSSGTPIQISASLLAGGFVAVVAFCLMAAILPLVKVVRLEPALVFQG